MERRARAHLDTACSIVENYQGRQPFAAELKAYFRENKKHGSRDRKEIAHMCYAFYRLGKSLPGLSVSERILAGLLFSSPSSQHLIEVLKPEWSKLSTATHDEKLKATGYSISAEEIFPLIGNLSQAVHADSFALSLLTQPDLFLRARPGKSELISSQLSDAGIDFIKEQGSAFRLANQSKADSILNLDRDVVIQDLSSQHTLDKIPLQSGSQRIQELWDCCAASGGKTILAQDLLNPKRITATDIRESILINLRKRFERAGITGYHTRVADLRNGSPFSNNNFDLVICDAPCSGSGTWGRTPEMTSFFEESQIDEYATLQKKIAGNAIGSVKRGGVFVYITCSVFTKENEDVVTYLESMSGARLLTYEYLAGYDIKADTLFSATFQL